MTEDLNNIKGLYEGPSVEKKVDSGELAYPAPLENDEKEKAEGMGIELK